MSDRCAGRACCVFFFAAAAVAVAVVFERYQRAFFSLRTRRVTHTHISSKTKLCGVRPSTKKITGKEDTDTIYEMLWGLRRQASESMNEWDGMGWVGHGNEEGGMGREGRKAGLDCTVMRCERCEATCQTERKGKERIFGRKEVGYLGISNSSIDQRSKAK